MSVADGEVVTDLGSGEDTSTIFITTTLIGITHSLILKLHAAMVAFLLVMGAGDAYSLVMARTIAYLQAIVMAVTNFLLNSFLFYNYARRGYISDYPHTIKEFLPIQHYLRVNQLIR